MIETKNVDDCPFSGSHISWKPSVDWERTAGCLATGGVKRARAWQTRKGYEGIRNPFPEMPKETVYPR
jgi:hypothetical protein